MAASLKTKLQSYAAAFIVAAIVAQPAAAEINVVASIPPVASLVEGVMVGVGRPKTLVPPGASLHDFAMKPSDAAALDGADVIFWVGSGLESFLAKPIDSIGSGARVVALVEAAGVTTLAGREGGVWEEHNDHDDKDDHDDHEHGDNHEEHSDHEIDGHIWLDPVNAKAMVAAIRDALVAADAVNATRYIENAAVVAARIEGLDREIGELLAPVKDKPFVVFHDAYHYLERHFGLNAVGSITVSPDRPPGAGRVGEIKAKIAALGAVCVFAEPQFEPRLITTLVEGTKARTGVLDPEGATLRAGADLYFELMLGLANRLSDCLKSA